MHTTMTAKLNHCARGALFVAVLAAAASACSYDGAKPDLTLRVEGLPANAVRAEVTLTDSAGDAAVQYFPRFGTAGGAPVDLSFAAPSKGTYTVSLQVQAFDPDDNIVGDGTVTSGTLTFPSTPPAALQLTLAGVSSDGSYGARCAVADGGVQACTGSLVCVQYQGASSRGVCTQPCTTNTCPTAPAPASTCIATTGTASACQWECDQTDGGTSACPPGLSCLPQTTPASGKKFCQPLP